MNNGKLGFCEAFVHLRKEPISFAGRPYLPAIYAATDRNLVLRCSRQTEKSTFLVNTILYEACARPGVQMLFVCPREEQAHRFSRDRLLPVIMESPCIRRILLGKQRKLPVKNLDFANGSKLYIRAAFNSADNCRGLSADLLFLDEFQDVAEGNLPVLQETLSHAHHGRTIVVGTPKSVENHLEAMFSQSTANEWTIQCEQCGSAAIPNERCLGPRSIVCPQCQLPLDASAGRWVPRNPTAPSWEGFWVNHLMVPWLNYAEVIQRQRSYDFMRFKNEALGLSSMTGDQIVTRPELEACCGESPMANSLSDLPSVPQGQLVAGIDWGGGGISQTVLTIGWMTSDYKFQVVRFEKFNSQDDPEYVVGQLATRCQEFRVQFIAADGDGNGHVYNRLLLGRLGNFPNLYAFHYSVSDRAPQQDGLLWRWTVNRSATIGILFGRVKQQGLVFPRLADCGQYLDEFACEVSEFDDANRSIRYTHPATQPDDTLHATNYALILATRGYNAQVMHGA